MADLEFTIKSDSPANDDLMVWCIAGHECLGRPSAYELRVLSKNEAINPKDVLGHAFDITLYFEGEDGTRHERHVQGHAVRFVRMTRLGRFYQYHLSLNSWFWLLSKQRNSRIFQEQDLLDVFDTVVDSSPLKGVNKTKRSGVIGNHPKRRYCVQHQERDDQFLMRLFEDEGVYYWFDAHDAAGTMHLADNSTVAHQMLPANATLHLWDGSGNEARLHELQGVYAIDQLGSDAYASRDSDFKAIFKPLSGEKQDPGAHALAGFEVFEFPGGYFNGDDHQDRARIRMEELVAQRQFFHGYTNWPDVAAGRTFSFDRGGNPAPMDNGDYLIGACVFCVMLTGYEGVDSMRDARESVTDDMRRLLVEPASGNPLYAHEGRSEHLERMVNNVTLACFLGTGSKFGITILRADVPYRPPRLASRVVMPGPQSAIVVGPDGEEIYADEFGRVKVQFHWDRYGESNENSTCWVRMSQPWAGKGWGGYFIPRIGQEVLVDFINGDPDRPVIIGRLYNDDQRIPYEQPTYSGFKTRSTPNAGPTNFNELRFRDDKDKEQVFIHAERRMDVRVKNSKFESVQGARHTAVGGGEFHTTHGEYNLHVEDTAYLGIDGDLNLFTKGNIKAATDSDIRVGATRIEANAKRIVLDAGSDLIMRVGGNFIHIDASGITMVGTMVKINSGGGASPAAAADPDGPLDAGQADTGEPGYLDRPRRGGPGKGRASHMVYNGQGLDMGNGVSGVVIRNNDGSVAVGGGTTIRPSADDPDFTDKVLDDLANVSSVDSGRDRLRSIEESGNHVAIERTANGANAQEIAANDADAAAPGRPSFNGGTGTAGTGTGNGSDSTVQYNPDFSPPTNGPDKDNPMNPPGTVPADSILFHELGHSERGVNGQQDATGLPAQPDGRQFDNVEERAVTQSENDYRRERGIPERFDHHNF